MKKKGGATYVKESLKINRGVHNDIEFVLLYEAKFNYLNNSQFSCFLL